MTNQCNFIGNLGKDPDIRLTQVGDKVAIFSIGVSKRWKDKSGVKQERTEWVNCTAFGKLADVVDSYLKRGAKVFVSGEMQTDKYTDGNGVEKYATKIVVRDLQMLDSRSDSQPKTQEPASQDDDFGNDVPF